jgi:hypothetical protein
MMAEAGDPAKISKNMLIYQLFFLKKTIGDGHQENHNFLGGCHIHFQGGPQPPK